MARITSVGARDLRLNEPPQFGDRILVLGIRDELSKFRPGKAYASWLDDGNVPESVIQSNLGHAPGSAVTRKHYQRAYDDSKKQAVIDLDVPLSTLKKNGRWQSKPKIWQSMATPK